MSIRRAAFVPSKTVLRVLRDVTFASSVVIGAVFTEDRRRHLHTLSQMADNSRKLQASPRYRQEMQRNFEHLIGTARLDEADKLLEDYETWPQADITRVESWRFEVLQGMWKNTRDMQQTSSLFKRMASRFDTIPPSTRLFNRMIFACMKVGDENTARWYLRQMKDDYKLTPDVRTIGFLALGSARRGDWDAVEQGLQELRAFRLQEDYPCAFLEVFHHILVEYIKARGVKQALERVIQAMREHQLRPDPCISNLLVTAMIVEGHSDGLEQWLQIMRRAGLKFDNKTFDSLLQRHWKEQGHQWRLGYQRIEQMIDHVRAVDPSLVDVRLYEWAKHTKRAMTPALSHRKGRSRQAVQAFTPRSESRPEDERDVMSAKILRRMRYLAGEKRNAKAALQLFKNAEAQGIKTSKQVLSEAVVAAMIVGRGDTTEARDLVKAASPGRNVSSALLPLLVSEMNIGRMPLESVSRTAVHFYRLLEEEQQEMKHNVTTHAAHTLIRCRKYRQAIHLLLSVRASWWGKMCPLDLVCMKQLLIAYFCLDSIQGVRWVVAEVLKLDLPLTKGFLGELQVRAAVYNRYNLRKDEHVLAGLVEEVRERWFAQKKRVAEKHRSTMCLTQQVVERMVSNTHTEMTKSTQPERWGAFMRDLRGTAFGGADSSTAGEKSEDVPWPPGWGEREVWSSSMLWTPRNEVEDKEVFFRSILLERNRRKFVRTSFAETKGEERLRPAGSVRPPPPQQQQPSQQRTRAHLQAQTLQLPRPIQFQHPSAHQKHTTSSTATESPMTCYDVYHPEPTQAAVAAA